MGLFSWLKLPNFKAAPGSLDAIEQEAKHNVENDEPTGADAPGVRGLAAGWPAACRSAAPDPRALPHLLACSWTLRAAC